MTIVRYSPTCYRGVLHRELKYNLEQMGFDTSDVTLQLPLQAVWTALEGIDRRLCNICGRRGGG